MDVAALFGGPFSVALVVFTIATRIAAGFTTTAPVDTCIAGGDEHGRV